MITMEAISLTSCVAGTLYLVDLEKNTLLFYVSDNDKFNQITMKLSSESIAGYVGLTGKVLNISDVYHLDPSLPYKFNKSFDIESGFRTKSMLVMPLFRLNGDILGVLQLINKMDGDEITVFNERDLELGNSLASQASVAIENTILFKEIEGLFDALVRFSATAIDARDPCTGGHSRRVAMYSCGLAMALGGFTPAEIKEIYYAAWLHDVGKIGVRESVLTKENKLTDEELEIVRLRFELFKENYSNQINSKIIEIQSNPNVVDKSSIIQGLREDLELFIASVNEDFEFIKEINIPGFMTDEKLERLEKIFKKSFTTSYGTVIPYLSPSENENLSVRKGNLTRSERIDMESHVTKTFEILKQIPFTKELSRVPEFAGKHHEKLDGSGYPNRLPAHMIPTASRIIAIADIYDALVAQDRPYKKAMPVEKALKILNFEAKDGKLDMDILKVFIEKEVYKMEEMPELDFIVGI
jgi:HD-GYP domain-containing protein (c-di-GMP phosphodiesterase class II)